MCWLCVARVEISGLANHSSSHDDDNKQPPAPYGFVFGAPALARAKTPLASPRTQEQTHSAALPKSLFNYQAARKNAWISSKPGGPSPPTNGNDSSASQLQNIPNTAPSHLFVPDPKADAFHDHGKQHGCVHLRQDPAKQARRHRKEKENKQQKLRKKKRPSPNYKQIHKYIYI